MEQHLAVPLLPSGVGGGINHEKDCGEQAGEDEEEEELRLPIFHSDPPTVACHSWWEDFNDADDEDEEDELFDNYNLNNNDNVDSEMRMVIRRGGIDSDLEMTSTHRTVGSRVQLDRLSVQHKTQAILNCLKGKEVDLWYLRELALSRGGLLNAEIRKRAWHKLVGIDSHQVRKQQQAATASNCNTQRLGLAAGTNAHAVPESETDIVRQDVHRAVYFKHLAQCEPSRTSSPADSSVASATSSGASSTSSSAPLPWDSQNSEAYHRELLSLVITAAIAPQVTVPTPTPTPTGGSDKTGAATATTTTSERLHYYQGFHDVASILLLNLADKPQVATAVLRKIGEGYLRDAMQSDFGRVTSFLGMAFYPLLGHCDEELHDFLWDADVGPEVVLPWVITWFAHDVLDFRVSSRFFDAFLASHPLLPFYVSIAVLLRPCHRRILLEETECEAAMTQMAIHDFVRRIACDAAGAPASKEASPEHDSLVVTAQDLIDDALSLMRKVPPRSLLALAKKYNQDQTLLKNAPSISFLRGPPTWNLTFKVPSDQVQRQQGRSIRQKMLSTLSSTSSTASRTCKTETAGATTALSSASPDFFTSYHRARVASGIASLMFSAGDGRGGRSPMSEIVSSATTATTNVVGFLSRVLFGIDLVTKRKRLDSPIDVD